MNAIKGAKYLFKTHAVTVRAADNKNATLVANAFEMPTTSPSSSSEKGEGGAPFGVGYTGYGTLWPVMLGGGGSTTSSATLDVAYLPPSTTASSFEVMLPSTDHSWKALPAANVTLDAKGAKATLKIPLFHGCALVRVKP